MDQRLKISLEDEYKRGEKYFHIISVVNDLKLTKGERQLLSFAAIKGNISEPEIRQEFCDKYGTSIATIDNIVYKMKKKYIILKKDKVLFVNPSLTRLDFSKSLVIGVELALPNLGK